MNTVEVVGKMVDAADGECERDGHFFLLVNQS